MRSIRLARNVAIALILCVCLVWAWDIGWVVQYGNGGTTASLDLRTDATGAYVGGAVSSALPGQTFAGGGVDAYVRKFGFDGSMIWTREFGTGGLEIVFGLATDGSGIYSAGITSGAFPSQVNAGSWDVFLRKFDTAGNALWTAQFGTSHQDAPFVHGVAVRGTAVYVAGYTFGTFPGGPVGQGQDIFLAKIDSQTGSLIWIRQFGVRGAFYQTGGITVDDSGVYAAGDLFLIQSRGPDNPLTGLFRKYDFDGNF